MSEQPMGQQDTEVDEPIEEGVGSTEAVLQFPPQTARFLSWTAIRFIHAPSIRAFQWVVAFLLCVVVLATALTEMVELDVSIDCPGEVVADIGIREAPVPSDGTIREILKQPGESVEKDEVIAKISSDESSEVEIEAASSAIERLLNHFEAAKPGEQPLSTLPNLRRSKILEPGVLQQLAALEKSIRAYEEQRSRISTDLKNELAANLKRTRLLEGKLTKMRSSKQRSLLQAYVESTEEELDRLRSQAVSLRNQESQKFELAINDVVQAARLALGGLKSLLRRRQVVSPVSGTVAKIHLGENAPITQGRILATIIPREAKLVGAIQVPSKDIVKVRQGQKALYRMEAYPYQHFGLFLGEVQSFDQVRDAAAVGQSDSFTVQAGLNPPEKLDPVLAENLKLVVGMRFNATIVTERKKIREYLRERLFGDR